MTVVSHKHTIHYRTAVQTVLSNPQFLESPAFVKLNCSKRSIDVNLGGSVFSRGALGGFK